LKEVFTLALKTPFQLFGIKGCHRNWDYWRH